MHCRPFDFNPVFISCSFSILCSPSIPLKSQKSPMWDEGICQPPTPHTQAPLNAWHSRVQHIQQQIVPWSEVLLIVPILHRLLAAWERVSSPSFTVFATKICLISLLVWLGPYCHIFGQVHLHRCMN